MAKANISDVCDICKQIYVNHWGGVWCPEKYLNGITIFSKTSLFRLASNKDTCANCKEPEDLHFTLAAPGKLCCRVLMPDGSYTASKNSFFDSTKRKWDIAVGIAVKKVISDILPAINNHICPTCKNDRVSKSEKSCWKCGNKL